MNGYAYLMSQTALDALLKTQYDTINPEFIEVLVNSLVLSGIGLFLCPYAIPDTGLSAGRTTGGQVRQKW